MQRAIDENLANAILNYLAKQPYSEVFGLINGLQAMKPVPPQPEPVKEEVK